MLIKLKRPRTHDEDRWLALWLATTAGLLNSMTLVAFGFFPSHMSGHTSQLSSEVSSIDIRDMVLFSTIILSFTGGSIVSRITVIWGGIKNYRTIFCQIVLLEGLALLGISLYDMIIHSIAANRKMIILLSFLMGMHNATSTQLSNGRVRSTHITGTLTDAGIAFACVVAAMLRRDYSKDNQRHKSQLITHLTTIFSFLAGGIIGLTLFNWFGFKAVTGVAIILIGVAAGSIITVKTRINGKR